MNALVGTWRLVRLALRRDRVKIPVLLVVFGFLFIMMVSAVTQVYTTDAERTAYALAASSSVLALAFNGPPVGNSLGSIAMTETFTFFAIFIALTTTLMVIRHTRQNEETGRAELVGAGVIGRHAQLAAALLLAVGFNMVLAIFVTAAFIVSGLPFDGSLLVGVSMAVMAIVFAAIAGTAAQLTTTARAANGLTAAAIGAAFLVRAVGDAQGTVDESGLSASSGWLSWLSPIGIARNTRPFAENDWLPLLLLLAATAGYTLLAFWLARRRDIGAGLLPARRGRTRAHTSLLSGLGLAWRLQRGLLIGWAVAFIVLAGTFGAVTKEVGTFVNDNPQTSEIIAALGGSDQLITAYLSFSVMSFGLAAAAYVVQALQRLRSEEASGRLESLLATGLSRPRWLLSHVAIVALGATFLLALSGAIAGLTYGLTINDAWQQVASLTAAALAYVPASLLFAGIAVVAFGALPGFAIALPWTVFAITYGLIQFSALLRLPDWLANLSPFAHIPRVPAEDVTWLPLVAITALGAAAIGVGTALFRRRSSSA
jgi:ABC-2 type transport system permease protein